MTTFLLSVTVASLVSFSFYFESRQLLLKQEVEDLRIQSELVEPLLAQLYQQSSSDVLFVSRTPPIQGLIKASNLDDSVDYRLWQARLEQIFSEMLKSKSNYLKISYVGLQDNAHELVTAVRNVGGVQILPESTLKEIHYSAHLKAAIAMNPGQIYFSPVELRHELNKIAIPYQPVIHVATPIYNPANGEAFGVVLIDVDFAGFIKQLKSTQLTQLNMYLANQYGDYLYHSDNRLTFGSNLGACPRKRTRAGAGCQRRQTIDGQGRSGSPAPNFDQPSWQCLEIYLARRDCYLR